MSANLGLTPLWGPRPCATDVGVQFASSCIRGLYDALQAFGYDGTAILSRVGQEPSPQREWFPLAEIDAVLSAAVDATGDEALGLHWGQRSPIIDAEGLRVAALAGAATLRDALDTIVQAQFLFVNVAQCSFHEESSRSVVSLHLPPLSAVGNRAITELALVSIYRCFQYLGHERAVRHINVDYPRPAHGDEYARAFGAKLRFDRPRASIEFASAALDQPSGAYSASLHRMIRGNRRAQPTIQCEQVERHVRTTLPPVPNIVQTAEALDTSLGAVRRCLNRAQTSYGELVDRVQRERALELLARGTLSLKEVAHATGFRSISGFQRAFRRWTGTSPARSIRGQSDQ